jgi:hypothetical protein
LDEERVGWSDKDDVHEKPGVQEDPVTVVVGFSELSTGSENAGDPTSARVQFLKRKPKTFYDSETLAVVFSLPYFGEYHGLRAIDHQAPAGGASSGRCGCIGKI